MILFYTISAIAIGVPVAPITNAHVQFLGASGAPLAGGFLFTYQTDCSTAQITYTDSAGTVPASNPIVLDSTGSANIWFVIGDTYCIALQNSAGVQQWTVNGLQSVGPGTITINGQTCTIGSSCTIPFQTNSTNNTSEAGLNLETSTTNTCGLTVTPTNSSSNIVKFEITGASTESCLPATTVFTDQNATFGAHTFDFSGATLAKLRVAAGLTTSVNGDIGYDTTNKMWHCWQNGADCFFFTGPASASYVNNDCVKFSVSGSTITLADFGTVCAGAPLGVITNLSTGGFSFMDICSSACTATGQYQVRWNVWVVNNTCTSDDMTYTFGLEYTDENATTHSYTAMPMLVSVATNTSPSSTWTPTISPANTASTGSGNYIFSSNGSAIQVQLGASNGCSSGVGSALLGIRATLTQLQ